MTKRREHDFDDGFDEDLRFDDDALLHERGTAKWRERKSASRPPKRTHDDSLPRHGNRPSRRRDSAAAKTRGNLD